MTKITFANTTHLQKHLENKYFSQLPNVIRGVVDIVKPVAGKKTHVRPYFTHS